MGKEKDYFKEDLEYTDHLYEDDSPEEYSVNPVAESTLNIVARIICVLGMLVSILILIFCAYEHGAKGLVLGILAGALSFFLCGLLPWACIKVVVNMSRNLHAIREELSQLKSQK